MPIYFRLLLGCALLGGCAAPPTSAPPKVPVVSEAPSPAPPSASEFSALARSILDDWLTTHPVVATRKGDHRFDDRWPELSEAALARDRARMGVALARIAAYPRAELSRDDRIDREILRSELRRQQFEHEVTRPWTTDPLWYVSLAGDGLDELVSRPFAPLEQRAADVVARLRALPELFTAARANLVVAQTKRPHTEVALAQLDGLVTLVERELPAQVATASAARQAELAEAQGPALAAIAAFRSHLEHDVLPAAAGRWRLGREAFARKLALELGSERDPSRLRELAVAEHGRVREQMFALARELAPHVLQPKEWQALEASEEGPQRETRMVRTVLAALSEYHVAPEQLRDRIAAKLAALRAFVNEHELVSLDDTEVLRVVWTPPHARGVYIAGLAAPGPLESRPRGLPSFYWVQPIPSQWSPAQRESYLREYNDFMLEVLSMHEAIPGHFVQQYKARHEPSFVRRVLENTAFVEGWAVYGERLMIDAGYAGPTRGAGASPEDPRLRAVLGDAELRHKAIALHRLKFYLRTVANAILDHDVHVDAMTRAQALELLVDRSYQELGEAEGKWIRAQVTSGQLSTYFVGFVAWTDLRARAEARAARRGQPFDAQAFHDRALAHGAPPIAALPTLMGWEARAKP